jgi:hypothetical protein
LSVLRDFLHNISRIFYELGIYREKIFINPLILFLISLILTILSATFNMIMIWILSLIYSMIMIMIYRPHIKILRDIYILLFFLAVVPGTPLLFFEIDKQSITYDPLNINSIERFIMFLSRVLIAPTPFIVTIISLGWPVVSKELMKIPGLKKYIIYMNMFLILIRKISRTMIFMLAAREARIVRRDKKYIWRILTSAVGDMILQTNYFSRNIYNAYKSRCIREC